MSKVQRPKTYWWCSSGMVDDESRNGLMCYGSKRIGWVTKVEHDAEVARLREKVFYYLNEAREWRFYRKAMLAYLGYPRDVLEDHDAEIARLTDQRDRAVELLRDARNMGCENWVDIDDFLSEIEGGQA